MINDRKLAIKKRKYRNDLANPIILIFSQNDDLLLNGRCKTKTCTQTFNGGRW